MTRILVAGLCPLPFENTPVTFGPGIRSWQMASGLAADGHQVELVAMKVPSCYGDEPVVEDEEIDGVHVRRLDQGRFEDRTTLVDRIAACRTEAVVGATIYGSRALARAAGQLPFWADQFGHVMAEAQARAALDGDNGVLPYFWRMARRIDLRADRFSSVSRRQRLALIGELGALGRLSAETCGEELVSVVPCAVVPAARGDASSLRGRLVPADAFVVLWSGSYNVWSDVETLFAGVERAMREESRIHFVSTGGAIVGHDEITYRRLEELIAESAVAERFHLEGWVPAERVPDYQALADLGVLTERPIYEGELGSKNRVVQWLGSGLPVAYNRVGDLGDLISEERLGLSFAPGDAAALAERILWASRHREELAHLAERARRYADQNMSFAATTADLRRWAEAPTRASDREAVNDGLADPGSYGSELREAAVRVAEESSGGAGRAALTLRRLARRARLALRRPHGQSR